MYIKNILINKCIEGHQKDEQQTIATEVEVNG